MSDLNSKRLQDVIRKNGNDKCADCGAPDPKWASFNLGIFLCSNCASFHRGLGTHISKVKSLTMDNWDTDQVEMMEAIGNLKAREKYEQFIPIFFVRPKASCPAVLREQWIRAKYERQEFSDPERQSYISGNKVGMLWKKGRGDSKFKQRRFELSELDNSLAYYTKENAKAPKDRITLDEVNCTFVPEKIGNLNGMQITYDKEGSTRSLFVYAEDGKDIVDWFHAIRAAKLNRLRIGLPGLKDEELVNRLTRSFTKEGWVFKTGPRPSDGYKKRWFVLDKRKLMYFKEPLAAFPKGEIYIGHRSNDFSVFEGVPPGRTEHLCSFTLRTPERDYLFAVSADHDREEWIEAIKEVLVTQPSLQDFPGGYIKMK